MGSESGWPSATFAPCARLFVLLALCAADAAFGASSAHAYCREIVDSKSEDPCDASSGKPPLFWSRGCISYVFNEDVFSRLLPMSEAEIRATFKTSYQAWAEVQCPGAPGKAPFLVSQIPSPKTTSTSDSAFVYDQPNESIVVVRERSEWATRKQDPNALALTLIWHDKHTGEILDVDMELNKGAGTFSNCSQGCGNSKVDLQNTITHEAGHLLGLGHSPVPGATMQARTSSSPEITKRSLEQDDKDGYCAIDLPAGPSNNTCPVAPVFPSKKTVQTCGCETVGASSSPAILSGALAFGIVLCLRLRRRQRR